VERLRSHKGREALRREGGSPHSEHVLEMPPTVTCERLIEPTSCRRQAEQNGGNQSDNALQAKNDDLPNAMDLRRDPRRAGQSQDETQRLPTAGSSDAKIDGKS
jgi:hypothetical protein